MSYGVALGWAVAATLLLVAITQAIVALRPAARSDLVTLTLCEALVYVLGVFGVLRIHAVDASVRSSLGLRLTHPGLVALGGALGLALLFPVESLRQIVERQLPTPVEQLAQRALLFSADTLAQKLSLVFAVACVGPLVEELFFRGALFGALRKTHAAAGAAIATAIAFSLSHLDFRTWPALLVVAAVLSHLRVASGSLLPCLALHVAFNAATIVGVLTGVSSVTRPLQLSPVLIVGGWLVSAALIGAVHVVARQSEEAEQARAEDEP